MTAIRPDSVPSALRELVLIADPADNGRDVVIATDLSVRLSDIPPRALAEVTRFLDSVLDDANIPDVEFKGLMHRLAGKAWGVQYELGPRDFLRRLRRRIGSSGGAA